MAIPAKGLRNLRTVAGRVDQMSLPYRAYMQITCLEMEKARRDAERASASRRIAEIDARLQEIEAEKTQILQRLSRSATAVAGGHQLRPAAATGARNGRALKVRY